jgi:hypothetical protein
MGQGSERWERKDDTQDVERKRKGDRKVKREVLLCLFISSYESGCDRAKTRQGERVTRYSNRKKEKRREEKGDRDAMRRELRSS